MSILNTPIWLWGERECNGQFFLAWSKIISSVFDRHNWVQLFLPNCSPYRWFTDLTKWVFQTDLDISVDVIHLEKEHRKQMNSDVKITWQNCPVPLFKMSHIARETSEVYWGIPFQKSILQHLALAEDHKPMQMLFKLMMNEPHQEEVHMWTAIWSTPWHIYRPV